MSIVNQLDTIVRDNFYTFLAVTLAVVLYAVYLYYFKYHVVIMEGDYDAKLKNIGRTIPPYPNGWYIACKSK